VLVLVDDDSWDAKLHTRKALDDVARELDLEGVAPSSWTPRGGDGAQDESSAAGIGLAGCKYVSTDTFRS
jgi:hypothetical protein